MGIRSLVAWASALVVALGLTRSAAADPKGEIAQKSKEAMSSYDSMDYDAARRLLNQAIAAVKKARLDKDPLAARVYLNLGIAAFAGGDQDGAKVAFLSAVQIDPKIQIAPEYRQPTLVALLEQARTEAGVVTGPATPPGPPPVDCSGVKGLQHTIIDTAKTNTNQPIEALVGGDVSPAKVAVMYRPEGAAEFVEVKLAKEGDCKYTGAIPGSVMKGAVVHYYVAAYDANNRVIVGKGSSGSPNIVELVAGPPSKGDEEDPINGGKKKKPPPPGGGGGQIGGGVVVPSKPPKVYVGVVGGTGFGYVTGKTEFDNQVENCCIGNSLVVITPEIGYYVNPQISIGAVVRLGIPVGANIEGHSTLSPSGLVRVRYALSPSGEGVRVMGQIGAGILRNTIKLNNAMPDMDTDIVGQGPLLIGAGVGYMKRLAGNFAFVADLSALGAIAVTNKLGSAPNLNSGLAADLSLGFAVGF
jgi:hypothetical protein